MRSVFEPSSKLGKSLIELIYKKILIRHKVEIKVNSTMKDWVLVRFNKRWYCYRRQVIYKVEI